MPPSVKENLDKLQDVKYRNSSLSKQIGDLKNRVARANIQSGSPLRVW